MHDSYGYCEYYLAVICSRKKTSNGAIMKRIGLFFLLSCVLLLCSRVAATAPEVSASSAILIEADTGEVIFEKNANERLPMASTTKIMTAVVALEAISDEDLSRTVSVAESACGVEGSSIYLTPGEELSLEELLYAMLLESANDAAAAIACEIAGGVEEFAVLMNSTAHRLGLSDTHFTNPHGLDNEAHYTTASDLARLTAYAMQNEHFREIVSTYRYTIPQNGDEGVRVLLNHNKLLRMSKDAIGVKTGFTKKSGRCLVSAAERDGVSVIAVTLNAPDDWRDHTLLHEYGFSKYHRKSLAEVGEFTYEIPCPNAQNGSVTISNTDELSVCLKNGTNVEVTVEAPHLIFPPINVGDMVGRVVFTAGDTVIGELPLYARTSVAEAADERSFAQKLHDRLIG